MDDTLTQMFRHQAWANAAFFDAIAGLDARFDTDERCTVLRLMNHMWIVGDIFAAHLTGHDHPHRTDSPMETPDPTALSTATAALDRWYIDQTIGIDPALLAEAVPFTFTDGNKGFMTRKEMLMHVALHGAYHRGEVGRILTQGATDAPWDTMAVFLHRSQPDRRLQGRAA